MAAPLAKGTVTSLSSIFSAEDARRASDHVQDAIRDTQKEIDQLDEFISENNDLISLVTRLPDELHHDIMVPFGKSAFFPGSLIHTNEFLVLLGESYYADRTSKQTVEILKRRGKTLEHHIDSFKSTIKDLNAEASFFDSTALEAAEGLVEIREELTEEDYKKTILGISSAEQVSHLSKVNSEVDDEDEDYALVMSRLDELEKEEMEADGIYKNQDEEVTVEDHMIHNTPQLLDKNFHISKESEDGSLAIQSENKDEKCKREVDSTQKVFEVSGVMENTAAAMSKLEAPTFRPPAHRPKLKR